MADDSFDSANVSCDPLNIMSSSHAPEITRTLTRTDLEDTGSAFSDVGEGSPPPAAAPPPPPYKGKSRDDRLMTSADRAKERQQAGKSSYDHSLPSWSESRNAGNPLLSKATQANLSRSNSPASCTHAPARAKGFGVSLPVPQHRNGGGTRPASGSASRNVSNSPAGSLIVMDDPKAKAKALPSPTPEYEVTSSPPPMPEFKKRKASASAAALKPGTSTTRAKGKAAKRSSASSTSEPAPAASKAARVNRPVPTTARTTGGPRNKPDAEWDDDRALSAKKRRDELAAARDRQKLVEEMRRADELEARKRRIKGSGGAGAGKNGKSGGRKQAGRGASSESDLTDASDDDEPRPSIKPSKKAPPAKQAPPEKVIKGQPKKEDPLKLDAMQALLATSRRRQAEMEEKQRAEDEKERDRFAREGPKVLLDGPMALIKAAGGRGALRALPSLTYVGADASNAVAGPSSLPIPLSAPSRSSRAASVESTSSSLTSLSSVLSESDDELVLAGGGVGDPSSSAKLCPYCSEALPRRQSIKLKKLLQRLERKSVALPTTTNPNARSISMSLSSVVCALHRSESVLVPDGIKKGFPTVIDWALTKERVRGKVESLTDIVRRKESVFWEFAKERASAVGKGNSRSARGQFDAFEKCQPGYFGEIGQILFWQTLAQMFARSPDPILTAANCAPLTPSDFIYWVLIPELAILLIQEDLDIGYRDAFDAMADSREFGLSVFSVEEGERAGGALMEGWDDDAVEIPGGGDDDEGGITVLRRRLHKTAKHRKTKTSQRAQESVQAGAGASAAPVSSGTARERRLRERSPALATSSQPSAASRGKGKRKEPEPEPEPVQAKKKPRPKPRLKPSGSAVDVLSSGAPQPFSSPDFVRDDVAGLTLGSSSFEVLDDVEMADDEPGPSAAQPPPPPPAVNEPPAPAADDFDDLDDFDFDV